MQTTQVAHLYLFTRTPLHVGAGGSVGAIDQPIQRERPTGYPIIPASTLKGVFADAWTERENQMQTDGSLKETDRIIRSREGRWLFGPENEVDNHFAGAIQFSDARLLAFPVRSARGCFAWITSPLILRRAARDGVIEQAFLGALVEPSDGQAVFDNTAQSKVALTGRIVLEEYTFDHLDRALSRTFTRNGQTHTETLGDALGRLLSHEGVWQEVKDRLVVVSDGMMSFFARNACEIAQHVRISDQTGTAEKGGLFNQENVPSETLFYALVHAYDSRMRHDGNISFQKLAAASTTPTDENKPSADLEAADAMGTYRAKLAKCPVFQFGGDASTGLGFCTVRVDGVAPSPPGTPQPPATLSNPGASA